MTENMPSKGNLYLYHPPKHTFPRDGYQYKVGIIMRTKDRALFLQRGIKSVLNQNYKDWQLIIVNDGGDVAALEEVLAPYRTNFGERLLVINKPESQGMEAASNTGIKASSSEFIVIHDDDDTWHPDLLQETVHFLYDPSNEDCGGVITHTIQVHEEVVENQIIEKARVNHNAHIYTGTRIDLSKQLTSNAIAPAAFLIRHAIFEKVGYFNEHLPVMGDWEFAMRLMFFYEIGIIPKYLTFYHLRTNNQTIKSFENSNRTLMLQMYTLIRNAALRNILHTKEDGALGLGLCQTIGGFHEQSIHFSTQIVRLMHELKTEIKNDQNILRTKMENIQLQLKLIFDKMNAPEASV